MFNRLTIASLIVGSCLIISQMADSQGNDPLRFPGNTFTIETKTVKTSSGTKKVTYRSYKNILYVSKPVDTNYHTLNVSVPVAINNVAVDAQHAPILLTIGVGGYMSYSNNRIRTNRPANGNRNGGPGGPPNQPMGNMPPPPGNGGNPPGGGPGGFNGPPNSNGMPGPPMDGMPPAGNDGEEILNKENQVSNADLALAAGYVVVSPGVRGRDNQSADGTYYGKAPAAIVDLKAAVRYIRHNKGLLPGNTDRIFSTGVSAGGALSALLGASGNSPLYEPYLKAIGAANATDDIYGSACFCPITDLEHADGAYEWMYGATALRTGEVTDQTLSQQLKTINATYQASLQLTGKNGFGPITAANYDQYLLRTYLVPAANKYLNGLSAENRKTYLDKNKWIIWANNTASFTFADYVTHVGRQKSLPAFDDFNLKAAENNEFGSSRFEARHFTSFSVQYATGNPKAVVESDVPQLVDLMNPMYFIGQHNKGCAQHWWLRQGTSDNHTSQTVLANLGTSLDNQHKAVNMELYWDAGHGADQDPEAFIAWIKTVSGL